MYLRQLAVDGLRNINFSRLQLSPRANFFFGANGSGKTSFLEAVYLLGRGRSFRTRNLKSLINYETDSCTVYGVVANPDNSAASDLPLGVYRHKNGDFKFKLAGEQVYSAVKLVDVLPLQLITSDSFQLLEGSPGNRRRLIDWGVFHVEQIYRELWYNYQKLLRHRNSLLRHDRIDRLQFSVWDRELVDLAEKITRYRQDYFEKLVSVLNGVVRAFETLPQIDLAFYPGWNIERDFRELLIDSFDRDRAAGYTHSGPHRADIRITSAGKPAAETLSRGQTKILVTLMLISQGLLYRQQSQQSCVYLIDDLPAELDKDHREKVGRLLYSLNSQLFVSGVEPQLLDEVWPPQEMATNHEPFMFHVEHGIVSRR